MLDFVWGVLSLGVCQAPPALSRVRLQVWLQDRAGQVSAEQRVLPDSVTHS